MKYWILSLLLLSLLLSGCQGETVPPTETTSPTSQTEPGAPTEQPGVPLLEAGEQVGEAAGLLYVPNTHVESFALPNMYLFGNGLLLTEHRPGADGGTLVIKRIRLEDGVLEAEASVAASATAQVQIGNGVVTLCDGDLGRITILNEQLAIKETYELPYKQTRCYMDQELSAVFMVFSDRGLLSYQVETGTENWIISNGTNFTIKGSGSGYLIFEYTDKADLRTYTRSLNMATGALETVPVKGTISTAYRSANTWLLRKIGTEGTYTIVTGDSAGTFRWIDSLARLIPGRNHLLLPDQNYRSLSLYNTNGGFISQCTLSETEYATVGTDFVWSGYWGGYFFVDTWENTAHLMFWDIEKNTEGTGLEIASVESTEPVEPVMSPELYELAADISERFGVKIGIAEQCFLEYTHYEAFALVEPAYVRNALSMLEHSLSSYPEGMLKQLPYGQIEEIRIELVGGLRAKDGIDSHPVSINGFAQDMGDVYIIVIDAFVVYEETIYHELSHIIDKRLEWYASIHPNALYSEEAWLALQPAGFRYAFSYNDLPSQILAYMDSGYFVKEYSMTFPTEDRATLMAAAMMGTEQYESSAGLQEKMHFYAQCIRESFNTKHWPEKTVWERP